MIQLIVSNVQPGTWKVHVIGSNGSARQAQDISNVQPENDITGEFSQPTTNNSDPVEPFGLIVPFKPSVSLIIRHTAEGHAQVANLLHCVRRVVFSRENAKIPGYDFDKEHELVTSKRAVSADSKNQAPVQSTAPKNAYQQTLNASTSLKGRNSNESGDGTAAKPADKSK